MSVFCTLDSVFISSACACAYTREHGCAGLWVCLTHMYLSSIIRFFLWVAVLLSTLQAQMAFDNGLNREMPGRHLGIDHNNGSCFNFPANSRRAVFKAKWFTTPWSLALVIFSSFCCFPSLVFSQILLMFCKSASVSFKQQGKQRLYREQKLAGVLLDLKG